MIIQIFLPIVAHTNLMKLPQILQPFYFCDIIVDKVHKYGAMTLSFLVEYITKQQDAFFLIKIVTFKFLQNLEFVFHQTLTL